MEAEPSFEVAVSQVEERLKSSVAMTSPKPISISGVGAWVRTGWGEGVAVAGNQTGVEV
jgi:hypothetical protein